MTRILSARSGGVTSARVSPRLATLGRYALAALALLVGILTWAFAIEPASLRSTRQVLELPGWPAECSGLRVAVLAELHVGSPFNGLAKLERIVARTNAEQPDLILLAGDFVITGIVGGSFVAPEDFAPALRPLHAPAG